jgi:hypothetical protein
MEKLTAWLLTLLGLLLVANLLGFTSIGSPTEGIMGWAIAVIVLIYAIHRLMKAHK